jgi:hypothetical protein
MNRRHLLAKTLVAWAMTATPWLHAAEEPPDAWIKRLSTDVLDTIKNDKSLQSGNLPKVIALGRQQDHAQRRFPAHDRLGGRSGLAQGHP